LTQVSLSLFSFLSNTLSGTEVLKSRSLALELLLTGVQLQARKGGVDRLKALAIQSNSARH
jgi:hypothetical protein